MIVGGDIELETPNTRYYQEVGQNSIKDSKTYSRREWSASKCFFYLISTIAALTVIYMCFIRTGVIPKFLIWLQSTLSNMYVHNKLTVLAILFITVFTMTILGLPTQTLICILATLTIKNMWLNFFFLTFTSVCASLFIYFVAHRLLYNYLHSKLHCNKYYIVIKEESLRSPWKTAFLTRILYMPTGLKDYILVMVNNPFPSFLVSSILVHCLYVVELLIVSSELKSIGELFRKGKTWGDKSSSEKFTFLFGFAMVVFTMVTMGYLSFWASKNVDRRSKVMRDNSIIVRA